MAKCEICGKTIKSAMNVSHSHIRTKRRVKPNLQTVRAIVNGTPKRVTACTRCLRSGKVQRVV
ncbi:MAG: 50S ribosomal protein L28 [Clostridiales bacterium]